MRDTDVFRTLLGLAHPWRVDRVGVSPEEKQLDLWLVHPPRASFACPGCSDRRIRTRWPEEMHGRLVPCQVTIVG